MKAHEILKELRANKTQFDSVLKDETIHMGFECEMILDDEKEEEYNDTPSIDPNDPEWDDLSRYLDITSRQQDRIDDSYNEWVSDQLSESWESEKEEYILKYCKKHHLFDKSDEAAPEDEDEDDTENRHQEIMDDNESDAREEWEEKYRDDNEYDMDSWISNQFSNNLRFIRYFDLRPEYGWNDDGDIYTEYHNDERGSGGSRAAHERAARSISQSLGISHIEVSDDYHSDTKEQNSWYIEPDSSITDSGDDSVPAEVVSSVYQVGEGLNKLKGLFDWMNNNSHRTDKSTGLHINLSIEDHNVNEYDFLKMMIFFDENYTANLFGRLSNTYAEQMRKKLVDAITRNERSKSGKEILDVRDLIDNNNLERVLHILKSIGKSLEKTFGKYSSIRNRGNGIFEFRNMGGKGYQDRFDAIRKEVVHMAYILKVGSEPNMLAKEYITKVFLLLNQGKYAEPTLGSGAQSKPSSKEFSAFSSWFAAKPQWLKLANANPAEFVLSAASNVAKGIMQLTPQQIFQLKRAIFRVKKPKHWYLDNSDTATYNVIASWMKWAIIVPNHDDRQDTLPFVSKARSLTPEKHDDDDSISREPPRLPSHHYTESVMLKRAFERTDAMRAHEILKELRANKTQFESILHDDTVRMGFECEMILDDQSDEDITQERSTVDPDELSWKELIPYLRLSERMLNYVEFRFHEWVEDQPSNDDNNWTTDEWIAKKYGNNIGLLQSFDISPRYGWTADDNIYTELPLETGTKAVHRRAAESISQRLGIAQFKVSADYHSDHKNEDTWYIEPDSSITDDGIGIPAEVVSSVYSVGEGLNKLKGLFDWMKDNADTDESTGLHINFSVKDKTIDDFDYLKMMIFFDENYTANLFYRLDNEFALQMRNRIFGNTVDVGDVIRTNDMSKLLQSLKILGKTLKGTFGKYASIRNRGNGIFEFRNMGGSTYSVRYDTIRKEVVHMAYIMKVGSDPDLLAKEYITKIFTMLNKGKFADSKLGSGAQKIEFPKEFSAFNNLFKEHLRFLLWASKTPITFIMKIASEVAQGNIEINRQQALQLKRFLQKDHWTPQSIRNAAQNHYGEKRQNKIYNVIASWMKWKPIDLQSAKDPYSSFYQKGMETNFQS